MDAQERLLIEHPIGKNQGFWTVHEVITSIKEAFNFEQEQFGDMGQKAFRVFQRWVKPMPKRKAKIIEVLVD